MLDQDLKQQLSQHFGDLGTSLELVAATSDHVQQAELLEMLNDLAETSTALSVRVSADHSPVPELSKMVISSSVKRPGRRCAIRVPSSARTSDGVITPALIA